MSILVTGHLGFVGQHLMRALHEQYPRVPIHGIDLKTGTDILTCSLSPEGYERVYHLAAQTSATCEDAATDANVNIVGTARLLQRYGSNVVLASSSLVNYPVSPYAISKRACEDYARLYGASVVRFCNLYGEGGHSAMDAFRRNKTITIYGDGTQRRTYAHVDEAVRLLLDARPGITHVLPGRTLTVNELAAMHPDKPVVRTVTRSRFDVVEGAQL